MTGDASSDESGSLDVIGKEGAAVAVAQQDSQVDASGGGPLLRSFFDLGELAGVDSTGWGVEEIFCLVEDVLSGYADCDVYVEVHEEPEAFTLRIGTRGICLPYPFTRAELYETLDELVQIDLHPEYDDPAFRDEDD